MRTYHVTVHYKTHAGKHGSRRYMILAKDEDEAIKKAEKKVKMIPGRIITGGDCVAGKLPPAKTYQKTHSNMHAAYSHIEKLKARGAKTDVEKKGDKYIVKYQF